MSALSRLESLPVDNKTRKITKIADKYLDMVNGGQMVTYLQYTQNTGEPGPHPGPLWESVTRPDS